MINRKNLARVAGVGAAATVAMGLFSTGAANADTFVPLPGAALTKTLSDGTVVNINLSGESANINPSMGATPMHRNAWGSGTVSVELSGDNAAGGRIYPGYIVGCQVNIGGFGVDGGAGVDFEPGGTGPNGESVAKASPSANGGGSLSLGPGQAGAIYVLDREVADDYGNEDHSTNNRFKGNTGSVSWSDATIAVNGCAGYAQARTFVKVKVETDNVMSYVTIWGQPFSIG
ncbi:MspA family porin [Nocardia sp. NPDC048505]|uniref:MspA family porin n=1 Tax=unclassified Nocardia TaxID=2637762 RepID=UPI0033CC5C63